MSPMDRILVSACLVGRRVRYDGTAKSSPSTLLATWMAEGRLIPFCPEVSGGLPVPRPAAEIEPGGSGSAVLDGDARVLTATGTDVTAAFLSGARQALDLALRSGVRLAVLKEGSPSCGALTIHDGAFTGHRTPGQGVTTALLERHGIHVFTENQLPAAQAYLSA